ncbi:hypothetical protein NZK32_12890 [Cyanobium sp. FGCU-52]|nr:hypothetical protein [Cyanobium sp. FGCU52]
MAIRFRWPPLRRGGLHHGALTFRCLTVAGLLLALWGLGSAGVRAQGSSPNQPESIPTNRLPPQPCPLLVPADLPALQPLRIQPSQVARKNRRGCLSSADALYGPDGCPVKLCTKGGAFNLPPDL